MAQTTKEQRDVIEILTLDHREVDQMFMELERLRGATDDKSQKRRKDLAEQATIELVRHSVAEEAEVYPQVKTKVDQDEAERAKHEHAEAELTMKRLEKLDPEDASFDTTLATLIQEVRQHVEEEEGEIFPHMRQHFTQQELLDMGSKVELVKKLAPTRPHPAAPDSPPGDKLLGPAAGLLDRMRDAISHRGTKF